jgi:hypothetical protein
MKARWKCCSQRVAACGAAGCGRPDFKLDSNRADRHNVAPIVRSCFGQTSQARRPGFGLHETTGRLSATGALNKMIVYAYQIEPEQLEGLSAWTRTRRYTIQAVAPPSLAIDIATARKLPPDQRRQAYLAGRQSDLQRIPTKVPPSNPFDVRKAALPVASRSTIPDGA